MENLFWPSEYLIFGPSDDFLFGHVKIFYLAK